MKIEIEVSAGPKGARNGLRDLQQIDLATQMVDRAPFRCNTIDGFRQAKRAHVSLYYFEFHTFPLRFFTGDPAHALGEINRVDLQTSTGKFDRVGPRTATKLANRLGLL